jgi:hypothetical protein
MPLEDDEPEYIWAMHEAEVGANSPHVHLKDVDLGTITAPTPFRNVEWQQC